MRRAIYVIPLFVFALMLLVQGCEIVYEEYDIEVINDTDSDFSVYLDDVFQFRLAPGGSSIIQGVDSGEHFLEARVDGEIIAENLIDLNHDIEWTVFVDRYDLTVINDTGLSFSVYLDGVFQIELRPGDVGTITGISGGLHTVDARRAGDVIAKESFDFDQDIEWTVF